MKNKLFLATRYQFRRKRNIFNIIFIGFAMFISILLSTYNTSAINYMHNDIYDSFYFKTLNVWKNENDLINEGLTLEDVRDDLSSLKNITNVSSIASYRDMLYSSELVTDKLDGYVEFYSANNSTLPKIVAGTNFPNSNGYYMICPEKFFPHSNPDDLKYVSINDKVSNDDIIGKKIKFDYKSNQETTNYNIDFEIIGLYENSDHIFDEDICYVKEDILREIVMNKYSDDIDKENNVSMLEYQIGFVVEVDDISNLDSVKENLSDRGYVYESRATVSTEYFSNISKKMNNISTIIIAIVFIFILVILQKKYKEEQQQFQLMTFLGYRKNDIRIIYIMSNIFNLIISTLGAFIISFVLIQMSKGIFNYYPFLFNKWKIIIGYSPVIALFIISLFATFISSILNTINLFKDSYE